MAHMMYLVQVIWITLYYPSNADNHFQCMQSYTHLSETITFLCLRCVCTATSCTFLVAVCLYWSSQFLQDSQGDKSSTEASIIFATGFTDLFDTKILAPSRIFTRTCKYPEISTTAIQWKRPRFLDTYQSIYETIRNTICTASRSWSFKWQSLIVQASAQFLQTLRGWSASLLSRSKFSRIPERIPGSSDDDLALYID